MTANDRHSSRIAALDLLRLVAALAVVAYHYTFRGAAADAMTWLSFPALTPLTKYLYLGVPLFFVISGFVITYSAEGRTAQQFLIARIARIYPGFVACTTITFLVIAMFGAPRYTATAQQWLANLIIFAPALKQPFMDGAYWSIVYEIVFYSWVLLLIATGTFFRRLPALVVLWLALSLANEMLLHSLAVRRLLLTDQSGFFSAGIVLYLVFSGRRDIATLTLLAGATVMAATDAAIGAVWQRDHFGIPFSNTVLAAIAVAAVGLVALCVLPKRLPVPRTLARILGNLTYPLYLLHQHIGFIAFNRLEGLAPPAVIALGTLAGLLALSYLVWHLVERPGQRWLKAMLPRVLAWPPGSAAPRRPIASPAPSTTAGAS
jgi:peptidoglycan/LPS O-acetylase OafA/YrhL